MDTYVLTISADRKWGVAFCMGAVVALHRLGLLSRCKLVQGIGMGSHVVAALMKILRDREYQLRAQGDTHTIDIIERRKVLQSRAWRSLSQEHLVSFYRQLFDSFCNQNQELEFVRQVFQHPLTPWRTLWNTVLANSHQLPQDEKNVLTCSRMQVNSSEADDATPVFAFTGYDPSAEQLVAFTNDERAPIHIAEEHTVRCYLPQETLSVSVLATSTGLPPSIQKQFYDTTVKLDKGEKFRVENAFRIDRYGLALCHLYWLKLKPRAVIVIDGCTGLKDWNSRHVDALLCGPRLHAESVRLLNDRAVSPFTCPGEPRKVSELMERLKNSDTRMDAEDVDLIIHAVNWGYALTIFYHGQADQREEYGCSLLDTALPDSYDIISTLFKQQERAIHVAEFNEDVYFDEDDEKQALL
jgi:hypothetical protein